MKILQTTFLCLLGLVWTGCSDSGQNADVDETAIMDTVIVESQDTVIRFDPETYVPDTYYVARYDTLIVPKSNTSDDQN